MKLDQNIFNELVKIVGEKNVSNDPVITQVYAFNWGNDTINLRRGNPGKNNRPNMFVNAPLAVVLPKTTEEVQKLVKLIDEVGLKFKAQSTGLGCHNCASSDDVIIFDLRRMNKIRKIDAKNMYAVIEPYVTGATLQAELIKLDLNCHMPGAGPMVSPLASSTSMCGPGFTSESTGFSGRNVLGTEWVLPTGEILRVGSLGLETKPDWYSGDGPGFSLRGVMRGPSGAKSGIGIFTAVAIKLYPYPCDTKWNVSGVSPNYKFEIPDYMEFHILSYRTWDAVEKALYLLSQEEIGFSMYSTSRFALAALFSRTKAELMTNAARFGALKKPIVLLICARTKRELDYKKKVLEKILEETKGKDLTAKGKIVPRSQSYVEALRSMLGFHGFLATGTFQSAFGGIDSIGLSFKMVELNIPLKKEYIEKKLLPNDEGESIWITSYEHGHYAHCEMPTMYNLSAPESRNAMLDYFKETDALSLKEHLNIPFFIEGDEQHDLWGPYVCNYNIWMRKIKESFDPNNTADSGFYISTTKELEKKRKMGVNRV
ncbi:MAG: FAD-binding oxidoreductase [Candidatus Helarchaeota archaeon]